MQMNYNPLKSNSELRSDARSNLKGNWGMTVLLCLIFGIVCTLSAIPYIGLIFNLLIVGPLTLGLVSCFVKLSKNTPFIFENLFDGFKNFVSAFLLQLLKSIFIFLWALLFIIPGIIAYYRYSMAFYILNDNPEMSAMDALKASKEMMSGNKWKLFCLHLSFIGWGLLCILTIGIGFLWLTPYIYTSFANFYLDLKNASISDAPASDNPSADSSYPNNITT